MSADDKSVSRPSNEHCCAICEAPLKVRWHLSHGSPPLCGVCFAPFTRREPWFLRLARWLLR